MPPGTPAVAASTAPPAPTPTTPALGFPELQGQRGLAALLVVVFHAYQYDRSGADARFPYEGSPAHVVLHQLDAMVGWFFVLSAFLLTLPYARAVLAGRPSAPARDFLGRRAVRIVPLYLVAVLVVWASRNGSLPGDWRDLVEHLTSTQVYDDQRIFSTIGPAWSLAVEVQFYVVLALVGALVARLGQRLAGRGARVALLVALVGVPALASTAWIVLQGPVRGVPYEHWSVWFGLPAKLSVFACGMAAAVVVALRPSPFSRTATWALRAAGLAVVALAFTTRGTSGGADAGFHALSAAGFALVVLAGAVGPRSGAWYRVSAHGALPWVGLVSYSLYLWHEPLLLSLASHGLVPDPSAAAFPVTALLLVGLGLLVAWASYWVVEWPASHLRFFLGDVPSRDLDAERRRAL